VTPPAPTKPGMAKVCKQGQNGDCNWTYVPESQLPGYDRPEVEQETLNTTVFRADLNDQFNAAWEAGVAIECGLRTPEWSGLIMRNADNRAKVLANHFWPPVGNVPNPQGSKMLHNAEEALLNQFNTAMARQTDAIDCQSLAKSEEIVSLDNVAALVAINQGTEP